MSTPRRPVLTQGMTRPLTLAAAAGITLVAITLDQLVPGGPERSTRTFGLVAVHGPHRGRVLRLRALGRAQP